MRSASHFADLYEAGKDGPSRREALAPVERALALRANGEPMAILMRQPGDDLELALGYCLTEGLVTEARHLLSARHCETEEDVEDVFMEGESAQPPRLVGTECLSAEQLLGEPPPPLSIGEDCLVSAAGLIGMASQLREHQEQHRLSGGTHAAALFRHDGEFVVLREDVGRNNAVDKVIGYCVLRQLCPSDMTLLVTGRASSSMVLKALRAGVLILASMSNTTSLGLDLAERLGLTLVTYLRGQRFQVCTHSRRIGR